MKTHLKYAALWLLALVAVASAGTIHTFVNGEALTAANLNAVLQHLHNNMVGGHGARLVDADVSASASIASSKLAGYRLIPRAGVFLPYAQRACGTAVSACTEVPLTGSTSVVGLAAGNYSVVLGYTATDASYAAVVTAITDAAAGVTCETKTFTTTSFTVACRDDTGTPIDTGFSAVVYDDN